MLRKFLLITATLLLTLTAIPTLSQALEFEARVGLGPSISINDGSNGTSMATTLSGGVRFTSWIGAYADFNVGGIDFDSEADADYYITFMPTVRVFTPKPYFNIEPFLGLGFGVFHSGVTAESQGVKTTISMTSWYSLKVTWGATYENLIENLGLGLNFEYYATLGGTQKIDISGGGGDDGFGIDGSGSSDIKAGDMFDVVTIQLLATYKF